jgi:tetratricopeptide (TPR) repeat protein
MPMSARFFTPHSLVYFLMAGLLLVATGPAFAMPVAEARKEQQSAASPTIGNPRIDPQAWFAKGQAALQSGDLDTAEAAFRKVLVADPQAGSAYANLGVIAMRRKDWNRAITLLHKAEKLEPKMAGIRLNIGIVEYRRGNYAAAIAPLSSVLRDQPDSQQARYLLGLCQVFTKKFAEAVPVLEPLWSEKSNDVLYLYLYDIAAVESGQKELDEKILSRMIAVGGGTPEFHLIMGKAFLNRFEVAEGKAELELAAAGNPDLPYLHLNLGITYMRLGDNERAEAEFRRDIALEPDLADNYEQLGVLYSRMQRDDDAEKSFREALKRDAKSAGSYLGLAKLYQKQNKPEPGLRNVDAALRLSPDIHGGHFLRGRILTQLGRRDEAGVEFATAQKGMQGKLDKEREGQDEDRVPNPELARQPQP